MASHSVFKAAIDAPTQANTQLVVGVARLDVRVSCVAANILPAKDMWRQTSMSHSTADLHALDCGVGGEIETSLRKPRMMRLIVPWAMVEHMKLQKGHALGHRVEFRWACARVCEDRMHNSARVLCTPGDAGARAAWGRRWPRRSRSWRATARSTGRSAGDLQAERAGKAVLESRTRAQACSSLPFTFMAHSKTVLQLYLLERGGHRRYAEAGASVRCSAAT